VKFTLGIHADIPAASSPTGYSMPGDLLWVRTFRSGEFTARVWSDAVSEGWMDPQGQYIFPADTTCWQYNFPMPAGEAFVQLGTSSAPIIYWLSVKAEPKDENTVFGWKTSLDHWNDDAVWRIGDQSSGGLWSELVYPANHDMAGKSIDLAFAIVGVDFHLDWGDAPDSPAAPGYGTLAMHDGARHVIAGPWLGYPSDSPPDAENDGQPAVFAVGDDNDGNDDEEGVVIREIIQGWLMPLDWWVMGDTAYVEVWVDYNGDKIWQHPGEQAVSLRWPPGRFVHPVPVPDSTILGHTYARYRISLDGGLTPYGPAPDGEVEDYLVQIVPQWDEGKWIRYPDYGSTSYTVRATPPYILADDFACTETGLIREINIWGGWKDDYLPYGSRDSVRFVLSFHEDIPASQSQTGYSMPGDVKWIRAFEPGEFTAIVYKEGRNSTWLRPPVDYATPGDTTSWYYSFVVPEAEAFLQQGTEVDTVVYWLDVQAIPSDTAAFFGWRTSWHNWNDAAVWGTGSEPFIGPWSELVYPPGPNPYWAGDPLDMAFRLGTVPVTAVEDDAPAPRGYNLHHSYPNPFNPEAVITYDVPEGGGLVTLKVYDVHGRLVRTLVNTTVTGGRKTAVWNGTNDRGRDVASGVYFYRMTAPGFEKTRKMVLLK
jgi:hypothetical protein